MATPEEFRPEHRIAYLGPQGTFSEQALLSEPDLAQCMLVPAATIGEAISALGNGEVDAAFVPIENSIEGSVNATMDELIFGADLLIQREVVLEVHLGLLGLSGTKTKDIKKVISFPHASAQCRGYLSRVLPGVEIGATNSTADAARKVSELQSGEIAAIGPPLAATRYGLEVLETAIEDHPGNQTRFVLISSGTVPRPTGHDRTAMVCFQRADRPGSLYEILGQFAARSLNLTRVESRPTKQALGDYCFIIEFDGHIADEVVGDCLCQLHGEIGDMKFLGSYPVTGEYASTIRADYDARRHSADLWLSSLRERIAKSD